MRVKCINDEDMEDLLDVGSVYNAEDYDWESYMVLHNPNTGDSCTFYKHRFEIVSDDYVQDMKSINTNKSYYFFSIKINDKTGYADDGVCDSNNGHFPLRQVEEIYKKTFGCDIGIECKCIVEISKDDYEWKHAEMSKFKKRNGE